MDPILKVLADNPALFDAVKDALLDRFDNEFSSHIHPSLSNDLLGEQWRARMVGKETVEAVFKDIAKYKSTPMRPERINGAR